MRNFKILFILSLAYLTLSAKKCKENDTDPEPAISGTGYVTTDGKTFNFTKSFVNQPDPNNVYTLTCWGYTADSTYIESIVEFPRKPTPGSYVIKAGPLASNNTGIYLNMHDKNFTFRTNQYFGNYGESIVVKQLADSSLTINFSDLTEMNLVTGSSITVKTGGKPATGVLKEKI